MREKYYGLLREYTVAIRERDSCAQKAKAAPEGNEREQVSLQLEAARKLCAVLRREIRRYPEIGLRDQLPPRAAALNHASLGNRTQAA
jgi:hypothetical protein